MCLLLKTAMMTQNISMTAFDREFNRGMGLYAAGGVQMLRTTQNRLKFEIRLDRPLYTLEIKDVMPISIGVFFSRSGSGFCLF